MTRRTSAETLSSYRSTCASLLPYTRRMLHICLLTRWALLDQQDQGFLILNALLNQQGMQSLEGPMTVSWASTRRGMRRMNRTFSRNRGRSGWRRTSQPDLPRINGGQMVLFGLNNILRKEIIDEAHFVRKLTDSLICFATSTFSVSNQLLDSDIRAMRKNVAP